MVFSYTDSLSQAGLSENIITFDDVEPVLETRNLSVAYGNKTAISNVMFQVPKNSIVSLIGPSGCGKSTLLRCFNRMNDLIPSATVKGTVKFAGQDIYGPDVDPTEIRFRIGMVFQRPNPFPKSIYENVAFGPRINGITDDLDEIVESSLRRAAVWDEVKDRLSDSGLSVSGGQQQRICIARALAVNPEIVLMDEPASSLDPISTQAIEQLIQELSSEVTIVSPRRKPAKNAPGSFPDHLPGVAGVEIRERKTGLWRNSTSAGPIPNYRGANLAPLNGAT